jgi:hypothetical protein
MKKKELILLTENWKSTLLFMIVAFFSACNRSTEPPIPVFQEAIFIMDADGSNKTKVIDVSGCDNVQFIPNSDKLLYLAKNSLYTVKIDGTENQKISGDYSILHDGKIQMNKDGNFIYALAKKTSNEFLNVYKFGIEDSDITQLTFSEKNVLHFSKSNNSDGLIYVDRKDNFDIRILYETSMTDSLLYSSNHIITGTLFLEKNETFVFIEANDRYLSRLLCFSLGSNEIVELASDASTYKSYEMTSNNEFVIYSCFGAGTRNAYSILDENVYSLGNIYTPCLGNSSKVIFSNEINLSGNIYIMDILTTESTKLGENCAYPYFSNNFEKIVYVGQYITNPKSKNQITN